MTEGHEHHSFLKFKDKAKLDVSCVKNVDKDLATKQTNGSSAVELFRLLQSIDVQRKAEEATLNEWLNDYKAVLPLDTHGSKRGEKISDTVEQEQRERSVCKFANNTTQLNDEQIVAQRDEQRYFDEFLDRLETLTGMTYQNGDEQEQELRDARVEVEKEETDEPVQECATSRPSRPQSVDDDTAGQVPAGAAGQAAERDGGSVCDEHDGGSAPAEKPMYRPQLHALHRIRQQRKKGAITKTKLID